ncbi:MAG: integrase [Verrucomicrobiales bacterium]|jgi:integrase
MSEIEISDKEPQFVKVAECLYRNQSSGTYFALVKRKGKQIRKSMRTKDRKLADRRLREFREKVGLLTASANERKTPFDVIAERWLKIHNVHLKPSSVTRNQLCVKSLIGFFGKTSVSSITPRHCEDWMANRGSNIAASTFNKDAAVLNYARRDGLILDNPASVIEHRKIVDKKILIPSHNEYVKLLDSIAVLDKRNSESAALVQLLALSGMRLGEATRIIWQEIDFENERFTVSGGSVGTKNGETRIVPLFPNLRQFLCSLHESRSPAGTEKFISIESTKSALSTACNRANLPNYTHHSFRHFFVSNAIEVGVDSKTIVSWIGLKDGDMLVAKTYGHLRSIHSNSMAALMK